MTHSTNGTTPAESALSDFPGWKLEDAKARLSELVRLARDRQPQLVTVRGQEAVVVISAEDFKRLLPLMKQPSLHGLLSQSPLSQLEFESESERSPVREVEL
ncbi:MAG: type II toxin-antitoxin system Phd/YefM family antitoxin [Cyanobacteria bacterium J06648_11]